MSDRARLIALAGQCAGGQTAIEDFVAQCDDRLAGIPLYPPAEVFAAGVAVGEALEKTPAPAIEVALRLISSEARETRALAVAVIHRVARFQPAVWVDPVRHLLLDDDWEVRDLAARVFDVFEEHDGAAEFHLAYVVEVVETWVGDPEERIRRAAPQALLGYARRHAEFRPQLLTVLDPLLDDEQDYVRTSYAAALRALGRTDPELVLNYLETTLERDSLNAAEVVRCVIEHPFANRLPEHKARLVRRLAQGSSSE
ncbi:MAG: DNA alkylation repair protein [bacterium]|nr:DNA alkylation repair protein [bacterium]